MSQSESFDAFYARTSWNVTSQMHALADKDPLADHAIREAYARAYQQWYEVSTYTDPEAWVLAVASDAYQRRLAEAAAPREAAPAPGHDPLSWPGMFRPARPQPQPVFDPDATLDPRVAASGDAASVGPVAADGGFLAGASAGGTSSPAPAQVPPGSLFGSPPPEWSAPIYATATIGDPADPAATDGVPGLRRPGPQRPGPQRLGGAGGGAVTRVLGSRRSLIVAATVVTLLVAGGIYYAVGGPKSGHSATPPVTPGPAGKPPAHMLAAGQTGTRSAIPWSLIGPGWTLAEVSTTQPASTGSAAGTGTNVTYLVDPQGGKYRIRTTYGAAPELLAWSGNGKEALYAVSGGQSYGLLTLASGTMSPLDLPPGVTALGFTRPAGLNILAVQQTSLKYRLERYNLHGSYEDTIAAMPRPAGAANIPPINALSSPDGTTAVWGGSGAGMELVSNAGGLIRKLRMPGTGSPKSCRPLTWWSADTVLAYCNAPGQPSAGRLWLAPSGGGQPAALTGISGSPSGQGMLTGAWQAGGAVFIASTTAAACQGAPSGSPGQQILQLTPAGPESAVSIPGSTNNYASVVAGIDGRLLVLAQTSCPGTSSLIWLNLSTHAAQTVLTAPSAEAGVVGAVPYGSGPAAVSG